MEVVEDLMELLVLSLGFVVGNCVTSRSLAAGVSFTLTSHIANHPSAAKVQFVSALKILLCASTTIR